MGLWLNWIKVMKIMLGWIVVGILWNVWKSNEIWMNMKDLSMFVVKKYGRE